MAKRFLFIIYLCLQTFLLCGYVSRPIPARPVVTRVDVYYTLDGKPAQLHLTDQEQMEAVLGCLRAADSHIIAENQHPTGKFSCTVRVGLANGKCHIYRQVSDSYFSKDLGVWKTMNPKQGTRLFSLIGTLETYGFQGAFLFCAHTPFLIPKQANIFDKCAKKPTLAFVRYAVISIIVIGSLAILQK